MLLCFIDENFFPAYLQSNNYIYPLAETAGDQRKNLGIIGCAVIEYFKQELSIDLESHHKVWIGEGSDVKTELVFVDPAILQSCDGFDESATPMMQLLVFIFGAAFTNEEV